MIYCLLVKGPASCWQPFLHLSINVSRSAPCNQRKKKDLRKRSWLKENSITFAIGNGAFSHTSEMDSATARCSFGHQIGVIKEKWGIVHILPLPASPTMILLFLRVVTFFSFFSLAGAASERRRVRLVDRLFFLSGGGSGDLTFFFQPVISQTSDISVAFLPPSLPSPFASGGSVTRTRHLSTSQLGRDSSIREIRQKPERGN